MEKWSRGITEDFDLGSSLGAYLELGVEVGMASWLSDCQRLTSSWPPGLLERSRQALLTASES
eukprot:6204015-Pleurochrysis_carterae.AAC.3